MEDHLQSIVVRLQAIFTARRRVFLAGSLLAGVFLLFFLAANRVGPFGQKSVSLPPDGVRPAGVDGKEAGALTSLRVLPQRYNAGTVDSATKFGEPRIAFSAELSVVTREFAHSRARLEEILERHRGYVAKLRMVGQPSGSVLSATLRVPSSEYRSALTELKGVGVVEHEEEAADEITEQHGELDARLVNAQNEERRLLQLLQNRTEKTNDAGTLEHQVSLLRSEIERIETERYASGNRVSFANISLSLREEHTPPAETMAAKLRNAAVSGLSDAFESISTILLFLASRGPMLAVWAVGLYFPARFFWRRYQQAHASVSSPVS